MSNNTIYDLIKKNHSTTAISAVSAPTAPRVDYTGSKNVYDIIRKNHATPSTAPAQAVGESRTRAER